MCQLVLVLLHLTTAFVSNLCPKSQPAMDKRQVKSLLQLAQSSQERELIQYTVYKSSGVTQSAARKVYGFENMLQREMRVEECMTEAQSIREEIDQLANTYDQAVLLACGIQLPSDSNTRMRPMMAVCLWIMTTHPQNGSHLEGSRP